ncbi:MAG: hypothetical protein QMC89_03710 [Candidatus Hodarchaeaceae archaeon]|nr:hypothetical protein [Candidatus Hodarchaeaceae archaeon]
MDEWLPISSDVQEILVRLEEAERRPPRFYERLCWFSKRYLGRVVKDMKLTENVVNAISFAKLRIKPDEWWAGFFFSLGAPMLLCLGSWLLAALLGADLLALWYLPVLGILLGSLFGIIFYVYAPSLAEIRRSEAQSRAIGTMMLLSFELYHKPDLRGATVFAADASKGELAEDLQRGLFELDEGRRYESVRHFFTVLAHRWGKLDEGTRQAIFDILRSTGQKEEAARLQDIAQAPKRVLESLEVKLDKRLNSLVMPTMAFMVFGSLAIVGIIGLSPIFGVVGLRFADIKFFSLTAMVLVASFLAFTVYMSKQRPATIPQPEILAGDPRLPPPGKVKFFGHMLPIWLLPFLTFVALVWPGALYLAGWAPGMVGTLAFGLNTFWFIWAIAAAMVVYAHLYANPRVKICEEERRKTGDWEIAFNTMGSRILDGKPMHQAMVETAELMSGTAIAEQLRQICAAMGRLSVDLSTALFERGLVRRIYNPLVTSFLTVVTRIRRGWEMAAGRACMIAAEFLGTLRRVENRFKERMNEAVGNLWMVAVILLPVVCAMSIWIMELMSGISFTMKAEAVGAGLTHVPILFGEMEASELALLKLIMGLLTLALALVMARYISVIRAGQDRIEFWSTVTRTILAATIVFTAAYFSFGFARVGF